MSTWERFAVQGVNIADPVIVISLRKTGATAEHGKPVWAWEVSDGANRLSGAELAGWHSARGMSGDLAGFLAAGGQSATDAERAFGRLYHDALSLYASDIEEGRLPPV